MRPGHGRPGHDLRRSGRRASGSDRLGPRQQGGVHAGSQCRGVFRAVGNSHPLQVAWCVSRPDQVTSSACRAGRYGAFACRRFNRPFRSVFRAGGGRATALFNADRGLASRHCARQCRAGARSPAFSRPFPPSAPAHPCRGVAASCRVSSFAPGILSAGPHAAAAGDLCSPGR